MENNTELVKLEQFVDKLLAKYKKLQKMYNDLERSLEKQEAECARLNKQIDELRSERNQVGEKVAGLIDRIERWESEDDETEPLPEDESDGVQGKLFQGGTEAADQNS